MQAMRVALVYNQKKEDQIQPGASALAGKPPTNLSVVSHSRDNRITGVSANVVTPSHPHSAPSSIQTIEASSQEVHDSSLKVISEVPAESANDIYAEWDT